MQPNNSTYKDDQNTPTTGRVLIVDRDCQTPYVIMQILAAKGITGMVADSRKAALRLADKNQYRLIFLAENIETETASAVNTAFELAKSFTARDNPSLVLLTDYCSEKTFANSINNAVRAIRNGFTNVIAKPLDEKQIEEIIDANFLANNSRSNSVLKKIVGKSESLRKTVEAALTIAPTSAPVLVTGESGTGKELISQLIHENSARAAENYIAINCAALNESLLESELFGHEKGAFTGAFEQRKGCFEMADGGTLLLDEITETPLSFQAKLLRVLEQQEFQRVGGSQKIKVNVRIISTSNKNLINLIKAGSFRSDLYYRLCGIRLETPPLRQRSEDFEDLIWHFVTLFENQTIRKIKSLDEKMLQAFQDYSWPGNLRQLRNAVMTSFFLGSGETLSLVDTGALLQEIQNTLNNTVAKESQAASDLAGIPLENLEQQAIIGTLRQMDGNQKKTAEILGISDRTLRGKIRRYKEQGVLQSS